MTDVSVQEFIGINNQPIYGNGKNEVKNITQLIIEMRGQVDSLLEEWATMAYRSYKANGNELSISLKLRLAGDDENIEVKSNISFTVEKITDEREGEIRFGQEKLKI